MKVTCNMHSTEDRQGVTKVGTPTEAEMSAHTLF